MTKKRPIDRRELAIRVMGIIMIAILIGLGIVAHLRESNFLIDAIVGIGIVIIVYIYRNTLLTTLDGTIITSIGLLMNSAGVLGFYEFHWHGIGWDKFLHMVTAFGVTLLVFAYLRNRTELSFGPLALLSVAIVGGFGAWIEIVEYCGFKLFHIGQGLFGMGNGLAPPPSEFERYDTQWDIIFNTASSLVAVIYLLLKTWITEHSKSRRRSARRWKR
jgi:hypothetical protein